MNLSTYNISLDIHKPNSQVFLHAIRGDSARKLVVTFTEGGKPYGLSGVSKALLKAKKANGGCIERLCDVLAERNAIEYDVLDKDGDGNVVKDDEGYAVSELLDCIGEVICQVCLIGADGRLLCSPSFSIIVNDKIYHNREDIETSNEYKALEQYIGDLEARVASGEFDGEDGADGYTPKREVDYWTSEDKKEILSEVEADKEYAQKKNELTYDIFEEGKWSPKTGGTVTASTNWLRTKEKIQIESEKVYNIAVKIEPDTTATTYVIFYDGSGVYQGFVQFTEDSAPPLSCHIVNGKVEKILQDGTTATYNVGYINITTDSSVDYIMLWTSDEPEECAEWLNAGVEPSLYYRKKQVFSKEQTKTIQNQVDRATVDDDKARFDNSFNYIAYSSVTGSEGAINTAEHYKWAAKQGFTALKGDVRPTSDGELIMCHDAGFTINRVLYNNEIKTCRANGFEIEVDGKTETKTLSVNEKGYITDGEKIYNSGAYKAYVGGYNTGQNNRYKRVTYDSGSYKLENEVIMFGKVLKEVSTETGEQVYLGNMGTGVNVYYALKDSVNYWVTYNSEAGTYELTENAITDITIEETDVGTALVGAYTTTGQQVFSYTTGKFANKKSHYYASAGTFGIRKLNKDQCLSLKHSGTRNNICDFDTFIKICKKYGKIAFVTIRDEDIENIVVPKMFDTLDKYSMREQSIINSFTFDTLEKVKNADSRIMLSNVLGARKYLSTAYITNALELGVCLINCVDSAKENGFKIMGPGDSAEANEARGKELVTARAALATAQASSIEAAQNAYDVAANLEDGDVKTAFQSILSAVEAVEDIDTAKFARTAANTALKLVNSGGSKSLIDAAQDAYDAAHQVVKAYGTIDAISNIPKTIALAKENNIRLYEAQVTSADDIEELMSYGIMGAQMGCVPNLPKEDIQLPKEALQLPEVPITSQEITSDGKLKVIFDKNEFPDGLKRLKILAQVIAPAGTAGGKALYCEGIDEDGAIYNMVYRSGVGATSTEFTKFTCGIDFDWFETNPIEKKGAAISQFFVFAGDSQSQVNTFALGTTDKKRPVAIQLYIKNVDAQEGSTIKVYGY